QIKIKWYFDLQSLDTTKDPCQKVKCSRHKVCVAQGYQRAMCVNRKKLQHRSVSLSSLVEIFMHLSEFILCTSQDLADLGDRLRDWFQLLHGNAKQNNSGRQSTASVFDRGLVAGCKDSIGWMFSKLDSSNDLFLDQSELAAVNLEKYEVCIRPFFNSCDSYRDGKVSTAEWCLCFWREKPPCLAEIERIQIQQASQRKPGMFIPSCDEDGYYRRLQCDRSRGECWCSDPHGAEVTGSRIHGNPDCDELLSSGDSSSGVGWEDEEETDADENTEEEEEEEESDDGGYIW
uniref:Testican-2-like n=1 Tax=Sinocyclocheilus rhinocerous TaxID=307959 RepID=A0A673GZ08_9TELE